MTDLPPAEGRSPSRGVAILVYTLLRFALFAVVWLVIEFLTPLNGLLALAAAILISGALSIVVLDNQRNAVGAAAAGFFGRINARIEASTRAEDDDGSPDVTDAGDAAGSADGERGAEDKPVDEK